LNNAATGLRYRKQPRRYALQQAQEWLDRLGVGHLKDRHAREISGGEAQRVSLARAFALQPELLMLDEPFSALDAPTRSRLLADFSTQQTKTSITTIFITHDLDEALYLGDQVAVLLNGRLRQAGSPQQVFSAPADREVAEFVGVETVVTGSVTESRNGQLFVQTESVIVEAVGDLEKGRKVILCLRPEDVTLWPDSVESRDGIGYLSSARNRFHGVIVRFNPQGPMMRVKVDCGFPLTALVTRASMEELDLREGRKVIASFKASAIHLIPR
jgi:tungstate transport system ATP-binding protein